MVYTVDYLISRLANRSVVGINTEEGNFTFHKYDNGVFVVTVDGRPCNWSVKEVAKDLILDVEGKKFKFVGEGDKKLIFTDGIENIEFIEV